MRFLSSVIVAIVAGSALALPETAALATAPVLGGCARFSLHGHAGVAAAATNIVNYGDIGGDAAITGFAIAGTLGDANRVATPAEMPGSAYNLYPITSESIKCMADKLVAFDQLVAQTCEKSLMGRQSDAVNCKQVDGSSIITSLAKCAKPMIPSPLAGTLAGTDLAGLTLEPGVYCNAAGFFELTTGKLTLDAKGDANAIWVFQAASTISSAVNTEVILMNGAQAKNVYWKAGSAINLADYSTFHGNCHAYSAITLGSHTNLHGRALANVASVTLAGFNRVVLPEIATSGSLLAVAAPVNKKLRTRAFMKLSKELEELELEEQEQDQNEDENENENEDEESDSEENNGSSRSLLSVPKAGSTASACADITNVVASTTHTGNICSSGAFTSGASTVINGNINAKAAITLGASSAVNGYIHAGGDITLGAFSSVSKTATSDTKVIVYGDQAKVGGK